MSMLDDEQVHRNNDDGDTTTTPNNDNNEVGGNKSTLSPEMAEVGQFMADFFRNVPKERYSFFVEKAEEP